MKVKYDKWHNNYDLILGKLYDGILYNEKWILIDGVLYRKECFKF